MAALRDRVRVEGLDNVVIEPVAAGDAPGRATLREYGALRSSWSTLGAPRHERTPDDPGSAIPVQNTAEVPVVRLDDLCAARGIDRVEYVKLDVEGAEPAAARGLARMLAESRVPFVQFEISLRTIEGMGVAARAIFDALHRHGYRCHAITDAGGIGDVVRDSDARHRQYIAIARDAIVSRTAADRSTPIHFFTIVLNGMPFIEHHLDVFRRLDGPWHWHVVEGVGDLVHDTAWCAERGGRIPAAWHRAGRSVDGTSAYLDRLEAECPDQVTVYRKPPGEFWDGKLEMVSAPLANIVEPCLLWQVDADELWTTGQIENARSMFAERPEATAAYYRCTYFVGPDRVITSRDTYGNHTSYEWLRTWRFTPGDRWLAHEPPRLVTPNAAGGFTDRAGHLAIGHDETEARGLVFQHYAYATEAQVAFKEIYYGYRDAVAQWRRLQAADAFPLRLRDHLDWVRDDAIVERAAAAGVTPWPDLAVDAPETQPCVS